MPQWRKLHAKTLDSLDVAAMPDDFHRLMWAYLPLILDREGRGIDHAGWLRARLFPLRDDVTVEMVAAAMDWYGERGMLERYAVEGRHYFCVPSFREYQGKTDREAASVIPEPVRQDCESESGFGHEQVVSNSGPSQESLSNESCLDSDVDSDSEESLGAGAPSANETDPVKTLAAVFEQVSGIKLPQAKTKKGARTIGVTWWNPLRQMNSLARARAPDLLRATVKRMRKDGLTIKGPISCLTIFTDLHGAAVTAPAGQFKDYA